MCTMVTILNVFKASFLTLSTLCISDLKRFEIFQNSSVFGTIWHLRNFYFGDAPHANYGERCSNHHFPHSAQCVYQIYSVLKSFEIAVSFAHFVFYKISTPVMPTTLCVANIVYIIISDFAHTVYIRFTGFWNFSKLFFVLHILACVKNFYPVMPTPLSMVKIVEIIISDVAHTVYIRFTAFWNFSKWQFVLQILAFTKFLLRWCAPC